MSSRRPIGYGVLLPHFGSVAVREDIVEDSVRIEQWGFDSVWVRDHIVFHPHEYEDRSRVFIDPIVALSAIGVRTHQLKLGTASLIPHRHPIYTALAIASLDFLAGSGRLILGWGLGNHQGEFDAIGNGAPDRRELLPEQLEIMRRLWSGESLTFHGKFYDFESVEIGPVPPERPPFWYCGTSLAAVRRAVEYCDGWIPGRMPRRQYAQRIARMQQLADKAGRELPDTAVIPWISPARTVEEGRSAVDLDQMLTAAANKGYSAADGEAATSLDDLAGSVIAGPADVVAEEVQGLHDAGAKHIVFDLRARFDDWSECLAFLGEEVLPLLRPASSNDRGRIGG